MGETLHRVQNGECISSIAFLYGFAPHTIWKHPRNEALRARRPNMFQLLPDDLVFVPGVRRREQACGVNKVHRFVRHGVPEKLRFQFRDAADQPRVGVPYRLDVAGTLTEGQTDEEGRIELFAPPDARRASIVLLTDDGEEQYDFSLGEHRPTAPSPELRRQLRELEFLGENEDETAVIAALRAFQIRVGIPVTGDADVETRLELRRALASR